MNTDLSQLTDTELDELFARLVSGGHRLERHAYYVYDKVAGDYTRTLQTWRETNELRHDILMEMSAR
jgi:hypothetical protein